jgi:hypothetical protein
MFVAIDPYSLGGWHFHHGKFVQFHLKSNQTQSELMWIENSNFQKHCLDINAQCPRKHKILFVHDSNIIL